MNDNVYLIPDKNYTFSAHFASTPPVENAIFLTEEGTYPVVFCYLEPRCEGNYRLVVCHDREELSFELNRSGKYYKLICALWDYDVETSDNCLLNALEEARCKYICYHGDESMDSTAYQHMAFRRNLLRYWFYSQSPDVTLSEKEIDGLLSDIQGTLVFDANGELYEKLDGDYFYVNLMSLLKSFKTEADFQVGAAYRTVEYCKAKQTMANDILSRLMQSPDATMLDYLSKHDTAVPN